MKREARIRGSRIEMDVGKDDDLQAHANFAKQLLQKANRETQTDLRNEIDRNINRAKRHALERFDAIESMKQRAKDIRL